MKDKVIEALITSGTTLLGVTIGFLLNEWKGYRTDTRAIRRQFVKIRQQVLTTTSCNNLADRLLELKEFFDGNTNLLQKRREYIEFYKKWIIRKELEGLKGQRAGGAWETAEVQEMKKDLFKLKI